MTADAIERNAFLGWNSTATDSDLKNCAGLVAHQVSFGCR